MVGLLRVQIYQKRLVLEDKYRKGEITWTYVILSRVVAKFSTTWVQRDLMSSILMNSNICKEGKSKDALKGNGSITSRMAELRRL